MNLNYFIRIRTEYNKGFLLCAVIFTCNLGFSQLVPDVLFYRFDKKSTTNKIPNLATNPPKGTDSATINGSLTLGDTGLCGLALVGTGSSNLIDYVDTKWPTKISGSWTFALWVKKIQSSSNVYYIFEHTGTFPFRCFTNGVAGLGN